ncbi:HAD family hydrolase [Salinicola rhizosphaerae]|uniref:Haloacid dehalogenase n=1 Tax=Salinicola rhizosphaerae TaxID=1443141 RepID=A0ABQ3EBY5_9GAMM|nr:HAD family hydrolase [Salinicola rhizosphaerae]GHB32677.1 haloacid dehalogenase [Salinicola rhizosphaerae]
MLMKRLVFHLALLSLTMLMIPLALADPLPSWASGDNKSAIIDFVKTTTDPESDSYLPESRRIAVFDNDGTLWSEQPYYFQLAYALDRAENAPADTLSPALQTAVNERDLAAILEGGNEALLEILDVSHSGLSVEAFQADVADWLAKARHPDKGLAYTEMVFQPMLELLSYLRDSGYTTYIVSGGGIDFMRVFAEDVYGIPTQNVIGSTGNLEVSREGDRLALIKRGDIAFLDDGDGKPITIQRTLGVRPAMAVGNSDGDVPMMIWATEGEGPRLGVLIHHTDDTREVAYDRESAIGKLDQGLDEAASRDWVVVDMAADWRTIYAPDLQASPASDATP